MSRRKGAKVAKVATAAAAGSKRVVSAATRAKMSKAQKERWRKRKAAKQQVSLWAREPVAVDTAWKDPGVPAPPRSMVRQLDEALSSVEEAIATLRRTLAVL